MRRIRIFDTTLRDGEQTPGDVLEWMLSNRDSR